jgi:phospholipid/cholesterol/gamma-HCH transport system substrate-binding protein
MTRGSGLWAKLAGLAVVGVVAAVIFVFLFQQAGGDLPFSDPYRVDAVVPTAVALSATADVRAAGVKIGKVGEIANRGGNAVLALELDRDHAPVYRDARVLIRMKSLAGENYVQLDPGTPESGAVPDGGQLPIVHADEATQLDEIFSALDRPTRSDLRRLLRGLGGGLDGHGADMNRLWEASGAVSEHGRPVAETLAAEHRQVGLLVQDFGRVMQALGDRGADIEMLARRGKVAAEATAARDEQLGEAIEELPATLRQLRASSGRLGTFSGVAEPVFRDLRIAAQRFGPFPRELGPAVRKGRGMMAELSRFQPRVEPLLDALARFANDASAFIDPLERVLREANPLLEYLSPYSAELGAFFSNLRSGVGAVDATGNLARAHLIVSESTVAGMPADLDAAYKALVETGAISEVRGARHNNPHPPPGGIERPTTFSGSYPRLEPLPEIGE